MSALYPDEPGHRGVETSMEAADLIASVSSRLRALVFRTLHSNPAGLTVDEACALVGLPRYSIQPRFSELRRAGSIRDTGQRRINVSGARAIVWRTAIQQEEAA
ncbi:MULTISPECIES: hypothetical protein [unclassified Sphingomonas]|uniref:hypothetical protein n=1 Tax=unclassified Sphingomonas TaxID=196159 RepID=UPI00226A7EEA|nr:MULTISPECIES: hypothetical protein [unclassified Sphingomonas]